MDKTVERLVDWTHQVVEDVAIDDADQWRDNPAKAIRHFYPQLHELAKARDGYANACFAPGEFEHMRVLHFYFLNAVNLFDIHPGCSSNEIFRQRYGLSARELANEVAAKRALVFYNAEPSSMTAEETRTLAPLLDEELGNGRLQLTSIRHKAFKEWLRPELRTEEEGSRIYRDYFSGWRSAPPSVREAMFGNPGLRIGGVHPDQPDAELHLEGVVKARWDHVRRFDTQAADTLAALLRETNNYLDRAILFTAVKDTVSGPITMAKGGLHRVSATQIAQQRQAARLGQALWSKVAGVANAREAGDDLLQDVVGLVLPDIDLPSEFSWQQYNDLRSHGYFEPIQLGVTKALTLAGQSVAQVEREEVLRDIAADYQRHKKAFNRLAAFRKIFKQADRLVGELLPPAVKFIGKRGPGLIEMTARVKTAGAHLAQSLYRARKTIEKH